MKGSATKRFIQIKVEKCLHIIDHNNTSFVEYFKNALSVEVGSCKINTNTTEEDNKLH